MAGPAPLDRRGFLRAVGVLGLGAIALPACGGGGDAAEPSGTGERAAADATAPGGWTFTDDRGITHTLDAPPERIAAQSVVAGALWEYGVVATGVFGPLRRPDGTPDSAIGLADPDEFTSLGEIDSQINLELLASQRPQIIVTAMWGDDMYWGIDDAQVDQIESLAPIVGIRVDDRSITEPLARVAELAETIGGSSAGEAAASARDAFDAASADLRDALEAKPDLRVVAASGTLNEMYVAYPPGFPELRYYQELGMDLVVPESHPTSDGFWETLSWEAAGTYPADLVLADARGGTVEEILELLPGTARNLPAIAAGQITTWPTVQAYGYGNVARNLDALTAVIAASSTDIA